MMFLQIKTDNMTEYCKCSGRYSPTEPVKDVTLLYVPPPQKKERKYNHLTRSICRIKTFRNMANYYSLPFLLETTEWLSRT